MIMTSRFLLFKASAGSGKTFNLAVQYIALLVAKGEREYRHTLAVTFTNKATAEMKDRILQFLYEMWKGEGQSAAFEKLKEVLSEDYQIIFSDDELREHCHGALRAILHDYGHFYVSTIDAFFQSVLRNMAHELGLNARLQVDIDDKDIIELAVESLIENLRHDNKDILPWLKNYIEEQLDQNRPWDVRRELKKMAGLLFKEEYLKRSLDPRNKPFDIQNIGNFRKVLNEQRKELAQPLTQEAEKFEEMIRDAGMDYDTLCNYSKDVRKYIEAMKAGETDASFGARLTAMTTDSKKLLKANLHNDNSLEALADNLSGQLTQLHELQERQGARIASIDLALAHLTPMGLFGAIEAEISRLSEERSRFMLAHTPILLKRMIQGDDASFIFERIGTLYNNIMIDEFQDTSRLQWENFRVLLLDNLASGGLSMVVGDIKQSIYRWRSGDWKILHELATQGHNGIPLEERKLDDNRRSLGNIVTFNNDFFRKAAEKLDQVGELDNFSLKELYAGVKQGIKREEGRGFVRIRICHSKDKDVAERWQEEMLGDLCQQVADLHQKGLPYEKMTILLRKNKDIAPTISFFAEHLPEVRLVSNEAFLLEASTAVKMIVCALQYVAEPERDPVAVRFLTKHYLLDVEHRDASESDCFLDKVEDILPKDIVEHREDLRATPLYELCEKLYRVLRLSEIENQDAYLFSFFDELTLYLHDNPSDIASLIEYWKETMGKKAIPNSSTEGIRIYTIHKSKGLAFDTVLMPFANWDMERDRNGDINWCVPQDAPLNEMGSLPISFSAKVKNTSFAGDYLREHDYRRADELNALYVAFTRAKDNLYVWGLSKESIAAGNYNISVADLMYEVLASQKEKEKEEDEEDKSFLFTFGKEPAIIKKKEEEKKEDTTEIVRMESYESNLSFLESNGASDFVKQVGKEQEGGLSKQQLKYIEQGKLLHYIFSKIERAEDIERIVNQFGAQGILTSEKEIQKVRELAYRGLRHEQVREWFSGRFQIFNECNILVPNAETRRLEKHRPDRVMMDDERLVVVDFKFGNPRSEYNEQVEEYMTILKDMYPEHKVEGWLWYVYKNQTERV